MPGELDDLKRRQRAAAKRALTRVAEDLLGRAQRLAPVEEGTLRASGDVDVDDLGDTVVATVSFNTIYAARQHEELDWRHPKGGQAKYLEQPLRENASRYERAIALEVELASR